MPAMNVCLENVPQKLRCMGCLQNLISVAILPFLSENRIIWETQLSDAIEYSRVTAGFQLSSRECKLNAAEKPILFEEYIWENKQLSPGPT